MRTQIEVSLGDNVGTTIRWGTLDDPDYFAEGANVSNRNKVFEQKTASGFSGFQLSANENEVTSTLNGAYKAFDTEGYPGYISRKLSREDGYVEELLPFCIFGSLPEYLIITFDEVTNEYATRMVLTCHSPQSSAEVDITNDETQCIIPLSEFSDVDVSTGVEFSLFIHTWSRSYSSIKVSYLSAGIDYFFNSNKIVDFQCSENAYDSNMSLSPGICEQFADIRLYDSQDILRNRLLKTSGEYNWKISIKSIDDTNNKTYVLGTYDLSEWEADTDTSLLTLLCRDPSRLFSKIEIPRVQVKTRTLNDFIMLMFQHTKFSYKYADEETLLRCEQIKVPNSWYIEEYLDVMLRNICDIGLLRIYWYIDKFIITRC